MSAYDCIISQAVEHVFQKLNGINPENSMYLTDFLRDEARKISKELRSNGQNVSLEVLSAKLHGVLKQKISKLHVSVSSKKNESPSSTNPRQANIDWYYITPQATYYQEPVKTIYPSSSNGGIDLDYLTNPNTRKIVVNVINDNALIKPKKTSHRTKHLRKNKNQIYTSPNTTIGSKTMEDLFHVVNNQRSVPSKTSSTPERVAVIDRYHSNSNEKERLRIFNIHNSIPSTNGLFSSLPPITYFYYNYHQPVSFTSMVNSMLSASYTHRFYPYIYHHY